MGEHELSVQEKHDLGHELTDGDVRELERGEKQTATDADTAAAAELEKTDATDTAEPTFEKNDDGTYTRDDGTIGTFGPAGFEPAGGEPHNHWL